jgi:hypothetical protein
MRASRFGMAFAEGRLVHVWKRLGVPHSFVFIAMSADGRVTAALVIGSEPHRRG